MKKIVIYDSLYGNTEKVARAMGNVWKNEVKVLRINDVSSSVLKGVDLLIVGSPTHGGRPTPLIANFLSRIPSGSLKGVKVAAFDTRFAPEDHGIGLRILMRVIRFAAERIGKTLISKGGEQAAKPEGFIVRDKEGPLKEGELERAAVWARSLKKKDE